MRGYWWPAGHARAVQGLCPPDTCCWGISPGMGEYAGVGLPHRLPGRPLLVPVLGRTQMGKTVHTETGTQSRAAQVGRKGAL